MLIIDSHSEFRGDDDVAALPAKGFPEKDLAVGGTVSISRVEEIDSLAERGRYYFCCGCFVEATAEVVASKAHDRYVE
jgi:hypothetical protein